MIERSHGELWKVLSQQLVDGKLLDTPVRDSFGFCSLPRPGTKTGVFGYMPG